MKPETTTLVMAGAREAHALVTALLGRRRNVIASLPEAERSAEALPVRTRVGRFENSEALAKWLVENRVATVLDASHAFDTDICKMVANACGHLALRYLRVVRPPWIQTGRDQWHHVPSIERASASVPVGARVFSNTGRATLHEYARFSGRKLYMRQTHPSPNPAPYSFVEFVEGHPPFTQFQEQSLFQSLGVTHLICRNVGGAASMSKLLAARALSLPVYMVARTPTPAHLQEVDSVAEALAWEANTWAMDH